jgi:sugar lactone lactonase YvrE
MPAAHRGAHGGPPIWNAAAVDPTRAQKPRPLVEDLLFPEGPRWHEGRFWFSDIHGHRVVAVTPDGAAETMATLNDRPSGLGFLPDGTPLVVSMLDRRLLRMHDDATTSVHADIARLTAGFVNDMVVDHQGRAYVGSRNGGQPGTDSVILVEPDGTSRVALDDVTAPNGTAVTADGTTLILAETHIGQLTRFTVATDGSLSERRVFARVPGAEFDGICLDTDGCVWSGGGPGLVRVGPSGRVVREVALDLEGARVVACVLGGHERRTMFMAIAWITPDTFVHVGLDRTRDATSDARGWVGTIELDVQGSGLP